MPSWWSIKQKNHSSDASSETKNNSTRKRSYRKKPKSSDESVLLNHHTNSLDLKSSSVSASRSSVFSGFDSDISHKKAYPLPKPSLNLDKKLLNLGSHISLLSSTRSSLSFSSSTSSYDGGVDAVNDHVDFASFRLINEFNLMNSWPTSPNPESKASTIIMASPLHPCHPLPLPPPASPSKSSLDLQSNWKRGKLLGRGTFGHVYAGFNSENGLMCAIKEVRVVSDDNNSTECLKQLNQEIILLSELSHPNIVRYYGSKMEEDKLSVYLEYISGGSIQKLLNDYGPFAEPVIRSYTKQILSGLDYLHRRNTVHRDIKGGNILVDPNGEIKLADFGMAKHVIVNKSSYSLAVDIWSLGCTVLEMATSKPPWHKYEGVSAIFKIANSREYPEIPKYLSEDAKNFVKLCFQRDPSARPTAAQLLHHPFVQNQDIREIAVSKIVPKLDTGTCLVSSSHKSLRQSSERVYQSSQLGRQLCLRCL